MKKLVAPIAFVFAAASASVLAAPRTVTLSVPGMYCAMCPITVKKALNKVDGVSNVEANVERRKATVTFDDRKATIETILHATAEAGYPSDVKK